MTKQKLAISILMLTAVLALSACASADKEPIPDDISIPIEPEVLPLITQSTLATMFEEAQLTGPLAYDEFGCWRASSEGISFLIVWPPGFTATAMIGTPQVLDTNGDVIGTAGMEISLGGGAREGDAAFAFEKEHPDLPLEHCPGPYWIVGEVQK